MNDAAFALKLASDAQKPPGNNCATVCFKHLGPDDHVADAGFILKRDKDHPLGGAGALPDKNQPRNRDPRTPRNLVQTGVWAGRWRARPGGGCMGIHEGNKNRTFCDISQA